MSTLTTKDKLVVAGLSSEAARIATTELVGVTTNPVTGVVTALNAGSRNVVTDLGLGSGGSGGLVSTTPIATGTNAAIEAAGYLASANAGKDALVGTAAPYQVWKSNGSIWFPYAVTDSTGNIIANIVPRTGILGQDSIGTATGLLALAGGVGELASATDTAGTGYGAVAKFNGTAGQGTFLSPFDTTLIVNRTVAGGPNLGTFKPNVRRIIVTSDVAANGLNSNMNLSSGYFVGQLLTISASNTIGDGVTTFLQQTAFGSYQQKPGETLDAIWNGLSWTGFNSYSEFSGNVTSGGFVLAGALPNIQLDSLAIGYLASVAASNSSALGPGTKVVWTGQTAIAPIVSPGGDATYGQQSLTTLWATTTDATTLTLLDDAQGAAAPIVPISNGAYTFKATVVGKVAASSSVVVFELTGTLVKNGATVTIPGTNPLLILGSTGTLSALAVNTASTTARLASGITGATVQATAASGSLQISVKGAAATTIQWVAKVEIVENWV